MSRDSLQGISVVMPVCDGAATLERALTAILAEVGGRQAELIAVDDGSQDASPAILAHLAAAAQTKLRVLPGPGRGAAAAINLGVRQARFQLVAQVDQDVVLRPGWLDALEEGLAQGPDVAAAQGIYHLPPGAGLWQRVMGLDLLQRYAAIPADDRGHAWVDHVCTGNTLYRREALLDVGLLDEDLGYGYDNDLSYRLADAGFRLVQCRRARADHHWRAGARAYLTQQYGVGYGRLDVVTKHPRRLGGDQVSGPLMMLHAGGTLAALGALGGAALVPPLAPLLAPTGGGILAALAVERLVAGARASLAHRDPAGLLFPGAHLLRDAAWAAAIVAWSGRRLAGAHLEPRHSMRRAQRSM